MKAIIVDDIRGHIKIITSILTHECPDVEIVGEALTLAEAEVLILTHRPDLVFLDIQLDRDGVTSFSLLEKLRPANLPCEVIFITSFGITHELTQVIQLAELEFITKPIEAKLLREAVERVKNRSPKFKFEYDGMILLFLNLLMNQRPKTIAIKLGNDNIKFVESNDIIYFEAAGHHTKVFLNNELAPLSAKRHLGHYANLLEGEDFKFQRVNNKILVNSLYMKSFEQKEFLLRLSPNTQINVSKRFYQEVVNSIQQKKSPKKFSQILLNYIKKLIGF